MRRLLAALTLWYAAALSALIVLFSGFDYEFMLDELDDGQPITVCSLPPSNDDTRMLCASVTFGMMAPLLGVGALRATRRKRLNLQVLLGTATLALWLYRFFGRTWAC